MADGAMLPGMARRGDSRTRWFCTNGAVHRRDDGVFEVTAGGVLVGTYTRTEPERRNLLLVALADNPLVALGELAWAFGMTTERLRQIRKIASDQGVDALLVRRRRGRKPLSERVKKRIMGLFDAGLTIDQAYAQVKRSVSRASVGRVHKQWVAGGGAKPPDAAASAPRQAKLFDDAPDEVVVARKRRPPRRNRSTRRQPAIVLGPTPPALSLEDALALGGTHVQHLGAWLMLGALHAAGFYDDAERFRCEAVGAQALRVTLDVIAIALTVGQRCVEGVRRLATPSAPTLLRSRRRPSPNWARDQLHAYADEGAVLLHLSEARRHAMALAETHADRVVLYVDNHLRSYTGKHVIRKGWRMKDKRVVPGCTDYYAHDAAGRPLMRMDAPSHDPLVDVVPRIARFVREQIGDAAPLLLVFDRAGAYPKHFAGLRDNGFEFVTYEKKPYPALPTTAFERTLSYRKETIRWTERAQKNLRRGRGRVRRICLLTPEGAQVNILAVSSAPAPDLVLALLHRWGRQENQFKHGSERWGINQLDGRRVEPYPEDAVIPNPRRRRLDRDLREARDIEAEALRQLAHLPRDHRRRERLEQTAKEAFAQQAELAARRSEAPKRAPLRDTELTGKLRVHTGRYKVIVDTIRIALANIETDLAALLAPHLRKPSEAKKTLANLLAAPGVVRATDTCISVSLQPPGTARERRAFQALLKAVNARRLKLPGDPSGRSLRFRIANS